MRLLEIIIPVGDKTKIAEILDCEESIEISYTEISDEKISVRVLTENDSVNTLLKKIEKASSQYRIIILPVEATLPRQEKKAEEKKKIELGKFKSISKEELYEDIEKPVNLSFNFILMVILSTIVAGIGILKNNEAIVIGAMVIAPFLGPNISMSFGTTLGDLPIIRKSVITGLTATLIVILVSVIWGFFSYDVGNITRDIRIEYSDILLALVCGFAGVISVISGQGSTLVGVMVAAALLPPLMRSGLFLGGEYYQDSLHSFLIFSTNIVCVNIAGIITFYAAGIRPGRWWDKENAKRKTRNAILSWTIALILIIAAIIYLKYFSDEGYVIPDIPIIDG